MAIETAITITYNTETGELYGMDLSNAFVREDALLVADVLGDAVGEITKLYELGVSDWLEECIKKGEKT